MKRIDRQGSMVHILAPLKRNDTSGISWEWEGCPCLATEARLWPRPTARPWSRALWSAGVSSVCSYSAWHVCSAGHCQHKWACDTGEYSFWQVTSPDHSQWSLEWVEGGGGTVWLLDACPSASGSGAPRPCARSRFSHHMVHHSGDQPHDPRWAGWVDGRLADRQVYWHGWGSSSSAFSCSPCLLSPSKQSWPLLNPKLFAPNTPWLSLFL